MLPHTYVCNINVHFLLTFVKESTSKNGNNVVYSSKLWHLDSIHPSKDWNKRKTLPRWCLKYSSREHTSQQQTKKMICAGEYYNILIQYNPSQHASPNYRC